MHRKIKALFAVGLLLFMCIIEGFYEGCVNADNCTGTFKEYTNTNRYTILYDGYHSLHRETAYSTFNSRLPNRFIIEYTHDPLTKEKLSSYNILVISTSIKTFSEEEIFTIKQFVEEGGGLLLMGQGWYWVAYHHKSIEEYPLNHVAQEFGVTINDDSINDPTDYQDNIGLTIFTKFASHPTTEGVTRVHSGNPSSLSLTGDAIPIVMGDEDSYSTNPGIVYEVGDYPPVAAALEYGKGKAVFMGHDILIDYIDHDKYDNIQFGVNIFDWFCGDEASISSDKCTVFYDSYHSIQKEKDFGRFFSILSIKFDIEYTDLQKVVNLSNCDILLISTPLKTYSEEDIYNIKHFVEEGGGLLLMGNGWYWVDYQKKPIEDFPFNKIAKEFGVTINEDAIIDHTPHDPDGPVFSKFADHPLTEGLEKILSGVPSSLSIAGEAVPIVMGDEDSYSFHGGHVFYGVGEYPPIAAALEYGKGRIIFLGHDCFFHNDNLDKYSNLRFGTNMFDWLSKTTILSDIGNLKIVIISEGVGLKAKIYVDGTYEGETDSQGVKTVSNLEADKEYTIRVEKEGYKSEEKTVKIEKDTTVQIEVEMKKKSPLTDILFAPIPVSVFSFIITLIAFLMAFFKVDIEMIRRKFSGKTAPVVDSGEELRKDLIKPHKKKSKFEYDIAISFAGENREIAKHLAEKLRAREVKVFYDEFCKSRLWGKELTEYFRDIYGPETRFVVVLMSEYYPVKDWTEFEFSIMRKEAERRKTEFILPVRLDDTKMEKIKEDVAYLDFQKEGIDGIVDCLLEKLEKSSEEEL